MQESLDLNQKMIQKKTLLIAFGILLAFFVISKILSSISTDPAQQTYEKHCASCHGLKGEGLKDLIPPLANADWLAENQDRFVCIIKYGMNEKIVVNGKEYEQQMDGKNLSEIQIYNIINYVNSSWGNDFELTTSDKVLEQFKTCENQ